MSDTTHTPGTVITNPNFWDCKCETNYIHSKEVKQCSVCLKCEEDGFPDSHQAEIDALYAPGILKQNEQWADSYLHAQSIPDRLNGMSPNFNEGYHEGICAVLREFNTIEAVGSMNNLLKENEELKERIEGMKEDQRSFVHNEDYDYVVSVRDAQAKELTRLQSLNAELLEFVKSVSVLGISTNHSQHKINSLVQAANKLIK